MARLAIKMEPGAMLLVDLSSGLGIRFGPSFA